MNEGLFGTAQMRILGGLAILMVMIALGSYASLNFERLKYVDTTPATISITGTGEVVAKPDIGKFTFSVQAEAADAATAQEESGTKVNEILGYLREEGGVAEDDVKTLSYNLSPRYRYEERVCAAGSYCPPGERVQDGFSVSQTIEVKVRDTGAASGLLAGVGERGATNISGLDFTVDDMDALQDEAREMAIKDAQKKAVALSGQLGVRLVRLADYYEQRGYQPYAMVSIFR
jgi:uncharacterized protein YggE